MQGSIHICFCKVVAFDLSLNYIYGICSVADHSTLSVNASAPVITIKDGQNNIIMNGTIINIWQNNT